MSWLVASLAIVSVSVNAQLQGGYFLWSDQGQTRCMSNAPNLDWKLVSGPYFDGECKRPLPKRPDLPLPAQPASAGGAQ
ncbi:hypothetical protein [Burkholderia gladioli]|uniref:hypothetical protein n=1 Tax=Burkholderia gladioli TaxID=28095 RepID=UPI0015E6AAD1|nr:hypothetical protein [Burkholderia gladioli]MBA1366787.1 hypothetical protein [Burkholderia gladioli]